MSAALEAATARIVALEASVTRMHRVVEAAKAWCTSPGAHECGHSPMDDAEVSQALIAAVDDLAKLNFAGRHVTIRIIRCDDPKTICGGSAWGEGIRVHVDGALLTAAEYGSEPEDNCESRDYSWVKDVVADVAKALGATVAIETINVATADEFWQSAIPANALVTP